MPPDSARADVEAFLGLAEVLGAVSPGVADLQPECVLLSDFGVSPRYPGWEPVVGAIDVAEVLAAARKLLGWAVVHANEPAAPPEGPGEPSPQE